MSKLSPESIHIDSPGEIMLTTFGGWSDGRIHNSGFSVLRNTKMPGVLLELGFINHSRDRARMREAQFQRAVAAAIVKGVRVFLGDVEPSK